MSVAHGGLKYSLQDICFDYRHLDCIKQFLQLADLSMHMHQDFDCHVACK